MVIKIIAVLLLITIIYCLGSAGFLMVRQKKRNPHSVVIALTWRIALSLFLFILLFIGYALGWIAPHGITPYQ